jgi:LmbE family N-acetylglucosaminyl deacetylase
MVMAPDIGDNTHRRAGVIVAHPDDETLWAGGAILMHPQWEWTVLTLCRASDRDRAARFEKAMSRLGARGRMADLDDGPQQLSLNRRLVQETALSLVGSDPYDLILTHSLYGEYTRHLRHEETASAVLALWELGRIRTDELWMFAYEDEGGKILPRAVKTAHRIVKLPETVFEAKRRIIGEIYGFGPNTFEARTAPWREAFWIFPTPADARKWQREREEAR